MITFKQFLDEGINDKGILKAVFVVGIPGSGKSYTISKLPGGPRLVNTDRSTEYLASKFDIESNADTWKTFFRDKAKTMTTGLLKNYLNGMLPLFVDGTSSDASNVLNRAGLLESLGYDVGMVFIETDLDVAQQRAAQRERKVTPEFIEKVHAASQENKEYFAGKFSFFKTVKNNPGELDDAAMAAIFKQVAGFYDTPVKNPVGKRVIEKLTSSNEKLLVPTILDQGELDKKVEGWYR